MLKIGRVNFSFAAAHYLPNYDGPCNNLHGHNYKLDVEFAGYTKPDSGMLADFKEVKEEVQSVLSFLDHTCLNDLELTLHGRNFPNHNPTAELMVLWLVKVIEMSVGLNLVRLRLWETDNCYAEWVKD